MTEATEADKPAAAAEEKPIEAPVDKVDVRTSLATPIHIKLSYEEDDGTEKVLIEKDSPRNVFVLLDNLQAEVVKQPSAILERLIIMLTTEGVTGDGKTAVITMAHGPVKLVLESIKKQTVPSNVAASLVFSTIRDLLEVTPIRAAMVTMVFEDQKPAAFAVLNQTLGDTLQPEDINMLVYHGQNNLDMFRDKLRKTGHVFPDDNPIIMPGRGLVMPK